MMVSLIYLGKGNPISRQYSAWTVSIDMTPMENNLRIRDKRCILSPLRDV